ncbi:MAG: methyltransferase domain-containing protein [Bacteroidales bacterium]|nr:methyltransferase domain-containing protein [Bacteroidales bacterium]
MANLLTMIRSGFTTDGYYKSMNQALMRLNNEYTMLHYPYHVSEGESFFAAQKNLTDYCINALPSLEGKKVLEIGCGNGIQAAYIKDKFRPAYMKAIDLNAANVEIARSEAARLGVIGVDYEVGDAQDLKGIADQEFDVVINIESAFHYPDKPAFLREVKRVLRPGGHFLIADILSAPIRGNATKKRWKKGMHLNHWPLKMYEEELDRAVLHVEKLDDITAEVIRGFQNYRFWLKNMNKGGFLQDQFLKLFYTINVELNIRLLKKRRDYVVITGMRPEESPRSRGK